MTDWHTDRLFAWAVERGATAFIHRRSRLVVDPERFADPSLEPMEAHRPGRGLHPDIGRCAPPSPAARATGSGSSRPCSSPYHRALAALVADSLAESGRCVILDCHSFATVPLPSEADQSPDRPDICIGTDACHTPPGLAEAPGATPFAAEGFRVRRDSPFDGALVPLDRYRTDLAGRCGDGRGASRPLLRRGDRGANGGLR